MSRIMAKIELARLARDVTQGELERLAGLPANRISKWAGGTGEPTARQAARIARALGVDLDWLCDDAAPDVVRPGRRGLSEMEFYVLKLAGRFGLDATADLITDAMREADRAGTGGGPPPREPGPPPREPGPPIIVDMPRKRARKRNPKPEG
jgi:transcriptional regulator with XRE-family HTH domain